MIGPSARRWLAGGVGALLVAAVFTTQIRDSMDEALPEGRRPQARQPELFEATAYCVGTTTASGIAVRGGIAAADPSVLPLGSVIEVDTDLPGFAGIWTILDTGPGITGYELDFYVKSCDEAIAFGRRSVRATTLRRGWDPRSRAFTSP